MSPPRPEIAVEFFVEEGLPAQWDEARLGELVRTILSREHGLSDAAIALHLVSDASIRALNAEHRGIDRHTDVLSFPLLGNGFVVPPDAPVHLGDVVISHQRAVDQAAEYGHSVDREIAYLVAHGVLHILGYDHEVEADKLLMPQPERPALEPLG